MAYSHSLIAAVLAAGTLLIAPGPRAVHFTVLESDESEYVTLNLREGMDYRVIGKCGRDCTDVDFLLYDGFGRLVDSDVRDDDWPIVRVTPTTSGTFRLKIQMASCLTRNCGVGVIVMGR